MTLQDERNTAIVLYETFYNHASCTSTVVVGGCGVVDARVHAARKPIDDAPARES